MKVLIWSIEHNSWWRENGNGYSRSKDGAGQYDLERAINICKGANLYQNDQPHEAIVPIAEEQHSNP